MSVLESGHILLNILTAYGVQLTIVQAVNAMYCNTQANKQKL